MTYLKKAQVLRLVEALSKLSIHQVRKSVWNTRLSPHMIAKAKFKGFGNDSFEEINAVYECIYGERKILLEIGWDGKKFKSTGVEE